MRRMLPLHLLLVVLGLFLLGCGSGPAGPPPQVGQGEDGGHAHEHPAHGPRDGHLVEFGDEQYHGEWILDQQKGTVTVFIMDGKAEKDVPIEADGITLDVWIGDRIADKKTYQLNAVREGGQTSTAKFELEDRAVVEALNIVGEGTNAQLTAVIAGEPYSGMLEGHHH